MILVSGGYDSTNVNVESAGFSSIFVFPRLFALEDDQPYEVQALSLPVGMKRRSTLLAHEPSFTSLDAVPSIH